MNYFILKANGFHVPLICWIELAAVVLLPLIGAILTWIERRKDK